MNKDFKTVVIKRNVKDGLGYTYNSFKITSKFPENEVKKYCMEELRPSYLTNDMPNPHVAELIEFRQLKNLNNPELGDIYFYEVRKLGTH